MAGWQDERPVLVAPDAFKGTLTALQVAEAIAAGLEDEGLTVDRCPVADGGEGTADVLAGALGGDLIDVRAEGPLGTPVDATFMMLHGKRGGGPTAIVEVAAASGLALVPEADRDPLVASSAGTGQLILAAAEAGARRILVACGGSATVDGGAGALAAITGGGGLPDGVSLTCLVDVQTPWERCARTFGPQKGASPDGVTELERRLDALAGKLPSDPRGVSGGGAAGGIAGGLHVALGATIEPGAPYVLGRLDVDTRMRASRFVVVGEGRLDATSLRGKAPGEIATRARQAGVPCHAVVGSMALGPLETRILDLMEILEAGDQKALREAGRTLAERWREATGPSPKPGPRRSAKLGADR